MLNIIYEFSLLILFFVTFKFYDIYVATCVIMVGATLQLVGTRIFKGYFDKKQLIIFGILCFFGGLTLYFHNPIFIKWKPTVVFWLLGIVFLISQFIGEKTLIQRMMSHALEKSFIPQSIWRKLNLAWGLFFVLLGTVNVFVAYYFSTETWVNFKLYGVLGALFIFAVAQSVFLSRYLSVEKS